MSSKYARRGPKSPLLALVLIVFAVFIFVELGNPLHIPQQARGQTKLDDEVKAFLDSHRYEWHDANIQEEDGRVLFDIIVKHGYRKALEIGTSTGRSGIWIAWALSKTGGKLITIEIDASRHKEALENFKKAGLSDYIDARLADAHELAAELPGPFDFVFVDADKDWYTNYLKLLLPKLEVGGCFAAHNVNNLEFVRGIREFLDYLRSLPDMETTIDTSTASGLSLSFKRPRKITSRILSKRP